MPRGQTHLYTAGRRINVPIASIGQGRDRSQGWSTFSPWDTRLAVESDHVLRVWSIDLVSQL
jgi:hypothetical protein